MNGPCLTAAATDNIIKLMYRRPKFLEELLEIREQMSRDAYYDADLFAEQVRSGKRTSIEMSPSLKSGSKPPKLKRSKKR